MSLLGALRRIENGADMWLAAKDSSSSNYSKAVSMLHAFSQQHGVSISDKFLGCCSGSPITYIPNYEGSTCPQCEMYTRCQWQCSRCEKLYCSENCAKSHH